MARAVEDPAAVGPGAESADLVPGPPGPPRRGERPVGPPLAAFNETVEDHTQEHKEALTDQHIS